MLAEAQGQGVGAGRSSSVPSRQPMTITGSILATSDPAALSRSSTGCDSSAIYAFGGRPEAP